MKTRNAKKVVAAILTAVLAIGIAGCGSSTASSTSAAADKSSTSEAVTASSTTASSVQTATDSPLKGKKVAYVMLLPSATIFQMWKDSCQNLCNAMGVDFDFFFCDGDFNKWQDTISTCAEAGYDGILVSHGNQDGSYTFLKQIHDNYPDMKIVTFDTQFYTNGEYQKIDGVTQMFQKDADKKARGEDGPVRLIKVWRGPNYNSPFDRREVGWEEYEKEGKIETVGEVQPLEDSVDSANTVTAAYLQTISRDDVDGIISFYDLYGQGVYNAILENDNFNGTNGDPLPMASVDIDNVDVTNMQTRPDIWTAAGTTDWTLNGEIAMRILFLEMADDYEDIYDPSTGDKGVDVVEVPGSCIEASKLTADSTVETLGDIAGETYGNLDYLSEADWMPRTLLHSN